MKKCCCQENPSVTIQPSPDNQTVILVVPKEQAYAVLHAQEAFFALYHLVNQSEIRSVRKYTTADEKFKTPQDAIEWAYAQIHTVIQEYDLDLDRGVS